MASGRVRPSKHHSFAQAHAGGAVCSRNDAGPSNFSAWSERCIGDRKWLSVSAPFYRHGERPPPICLYSPPWNSDFDTGLPFQDIERMVFAGWRTSPLNCANRKTAALRERCRLHAAALVVPSVRAHCGSDPHGSTWDLGESTSADGRPRVRDDPASHGWMEDPKAAEVQLRYWRALHHRWQEAPHRLVVVHCDHPWEIQHNIQMMRALQLLPDSFVQKVVILTMENGLRTSRALSFLKTAAVLPTLLVVPFVVPSSWTHDPSRELHGRPFAVMQTGRPNNPSRRAIYLQLLEAGAVCRGPESLSFDLRSICADANSNRCEAWRACTHRQCALFETEAGLDCLLCAHETTPKSPAESCREKLMNAPRKHWPPNSAGTVQLDAALHSTFCVETRSDSAIRSHFYLSMHAGCIPVILDFLHTPGPFPSPPELPWAWRAPDLPELRHVLMRSQAGRRAQDLLGHFERFAIIYNSSLVQSDFENHHHGKQLPEMAGRLSGVVRSLAELATAEPSAALRHPTVRQLQQGVGRAAPWFRYPVLDVPACVSETVATSLPSRPQPPVDASYPLPPQPHPSQSQSPQSQPQIHGVASTPCDAFTMLAAALEAQALRLRVANEPPAPPKLEPS